MFELCLLLVVFDLNFQTFILLIDLPGMDFQLLETQLEFILPVKALFIELTDQTVGLIGYRY